MSSYKISFEQIRLQASLADMLQALERGFKKFDIDFYLVGAVSRNVWMSGINKISPRRTTASIRYLPVRGKSVWSSGDFYRYF